MQKPDIHILVCNSFRLSGEPQGTCHKKGAANLLGILENEVVERGLNAQVSSTSCLKRCEHGPSMVIYPAGWWYDAVDEKKLDPILSALEDGRPATQFLAT
jgi:(2Fe-2S) ferredoxin